MKKDCGTTDTIHRYQMVLELGAIITSEVNIDALFSVIADQANRVMETERCSVFLYDEDRDELWSFVSTDLRKGEIRISASEGIAGWTFQHQEALIINDAYGDPRFYPAVDQKTGFTTRNILCIPLVNRDRICIGVLQTLNRKDGDFTKVDVDLLTSASHYIAIALENATLYEQLDLMLKAKERVINHLAHELKTPLAVIAGALGRIEKKTCADCSKDLCRTIDRGKRNIGRLVDLQNKIDDILNLRQKDTQKQIISVIESAADLAEELSEETDGVRKQVLELISKRLDGIFHLEKPCKRTIDLGPFLDRRCDRIESEMGHRDIRIERELERPIILVADPDILALSFRGLLKNAIENVPNEGRIRVSTYKEDDQVSIRIHDYGVGITPENQKIIFVGFFHTQVTDKYSSKAPYAFNAGGAGADLLRIKTFAERAGFEVDFESRRCCYLPSDGDACPGSISECGFISAPKECRRSGFSTFVLRFISSGQSAPDSH